MSQPYEQYQFPQHDNGDPESTVPLEDAVEQPLAPLIDMQAYRERKEQGSEQPLASFKKTEQDIETLRKNADETTIPRYRLRVLLYLAQKLIGPRPEGNLEKQLVDIESEIGGRLLTQVTGIKSQRFWYHDGNWFYEAVDTKGPLHARYQLSDTDIIKLVDGLSTMLAEEEKQNLLATIPRYHDAIKDELYERESRKDIAA